MFKDEIQRISEEIDNWHDQANMQGIWVFLATLGCWGVTDDLLCILALIIVASIFVYLISKGVKFKGSFDAQLNKLSANVRLHYGDSDEGKARLYDITSLKVEKISLRTGFLRVLIGTLGIIFWAATSYHFLYRLINHSSI